MSWEALTLSFSRETVLMLLHWSWCLSHWLHRSCHVRWNVVSASLDLRVLTVHSNTRHVGRRGSSILSVGLRVSRAGTLACPPLSPGWFVAGLSPLGGDPPCTPLPSCGGDAGVAGRTRSILPTSACLVTLVSSPASTFAGCPAAGVPREPQPCPSSTLVDHLELS